MHQQQTKMFEKIYEIGLKWDELIPTCPWGKETLRVVHGKNADVINETCVFPTEHLKIESLKAFATNCAQPDFMHMVAMYDIINTDNNSLYDIGGAFIDSGCVPPARIMNVVKDIDRFSGMFYNRVVEGKQMLAMMCQFLESLSEEVREKHVYEVEEVIEKLVLLGMNVRKHSVNGFSLVLPYNRFSNIVETTFSIKCKIKHIAHLVGTHNTLYINRKECHPLSNWTRDEVIKAIAEAYLYISLTNFEPLEDFKENYCKYLTTLFDEKSHSMNDLCEAAVDVANEIRDFSLSNDEKAIEIKEDRGEVLDVLLKEYEKYEQRSN